MPFINESSTTDHDTTPEDNDTSGAAAGPSVHEIHRRRSKVHDGRLPGEASAGDGGTGGRLATAADVQRYREAHGGRLPHEDGGR